MGRSERLVLGAIVLLAAALRFSTLGLQSLDFDESYTVLVVGGSLSHVFAQLPVTESTPPLFYVLEWGVVHVLGSSAEALRLLSAVCGTLTVPAAFLAARRLASLRAGLVAAGLVAVNPELVWYSQEARSYALVGLLSVLSLLALATALDTGRARHVLWWTLAGAAAIATHYFAGFVVLAEGVWLLWRWPGRRRVALAGVALTGALAAALVPLAVEQAGHGRTEWIEALSLPARTREVGKKWLTGEIASVPRWLLIAFLLAGAALMVSALREAGPRVRRGAGLAATIGGGAVLVSLAVDLAGGHYLVAKNEIPALVVLLVAAGCALSAAAPGRVGAALAAVAFLALPVAVDFTPSMQRPDYGDAAAALGPRAADEPVVVPRLGDAPLLVSRPGALPLAAGTPVRSVVLILTLPRADARSHRQPTPPAPRGFTLAGRLDTGRYSLVCYRPLDGASAAVAPAGLIALGGRDASALAWPGAPAARTLPPVCEPPLRAGL